MFTLSFETANDAFVEGPTEEVARILANVSALVGMGTQFGTVRDANGNAVGTWSLNPT